MVRLYIINFFLLFQKMKWEYTHDCDYYGRRKRPYKTFFGKKFYGEWEEADLMVFRK